MLSQGISMGVALGWNAGLERCGSVPRRLVLLRLGCCRRCWSGHCIRPASSAGRRRAVLPTRCFQPHSWHLPHFGRRPGCSLRAEAQAPYPGQTCATGCQPPAALTGLPVPCSLLRGASDGWGNLQRKYRRGVQNRVVLRSGLRGGRHAALRIEASGMQLARLQGKALPSLRDGRPGVIRPAPSARSRQRCFAVIG